MSKVAKSPPFLTSVAGTRLRRCQAIASCAEELQHCGHRRDLTTHILETRQCAFSMTPATELSFRSTEQTIQNAVTTRTLKSKIWVKEIPSFAKSAAWAPSSGSALALLLLVMSRPLSLCQLYRKNKKGKPGLLTERDSHVSLRSCVSWYDAEVCKVPLTRWRIFKSLILESWEAMASKPEQGGVTVLTGHECCHKSKLNKPNKIRSSLHSH